MATWTETNTHAFERTDGETVGDGWEPRRGGSAAIAANRLLLTAISPTTGAAMAGELQVLRPATEAALDQRIDAVWTLEDTAPSTGRMLYLRAKTDRIGGRDFWSTYAGRVTNSGTLQLR